VGDVTVTLLRTSSEFAEDRIFTVALHELTEGSAERNVGTIGPQGKLVFATPPGEYRIEVRSISGSRRAGWVGSIRANLVADDIVTLTCTATARRMYKLRYAIVLGAPLAAVAVPFIIANNARVIEILMQAAGGSFIGGSEPATPRSGDVDTPREAPFEVVDIVETGTSYESIGDEDRVGENKSRNSTATRTYRVVREWTRTWQFTEEASAGGGIKAKAGPDWLRLEANIAAQIKESYSMTRTERREFSDEVGLQISPGASVVLTLHWKQVWQHGIVKVKRRDEMLDVPFKVAKAITFDYSTRDV
jgi:hypothetical protein